MLSFFLYFSANKQQEFIVISYNTRFNEVWVLGGGQWIWHSPSSVDVRFVCFIYVSYQHFWDIIQITFIWADCHVGEVGAMGATAFRYLSEWNRLTFFCKMSRHFPDVLAAAKPKPLGIMLRYFLDVLMATNPDVFEHLSARNWVFRTICNRVLDDRTRSVVPKPNRTIGTTMSQYKSELEHNKRKVSKEMYMYSSVGDSTVPFID